MKRWMIGLLGLLLAAGVAEAAPYNARIRWTSHGIPHVRATDLGGLGFGIGYAFTEKNACLLFDTAMTVRGERSRYLGPTAMALPGYTPVPNLESDAFFRGYFDPAALTAAYEAQEPEARALLAGFAAGANQYLVRKGLDHLPVACRNAPWVKPLTLQDMVMMVAQKAVEGSGTAMLGAMLAAHPPGVAPKPSATPARSGAVALPQNDGSQGGSNGYALGASLTAGGSGLLLANPHFPWAGHNRFFEMQLTIPGRLDAMGAMLFPLPTVTIGFNRDVAWTHTVSTARRFTLFQLTLRPGHPLEYMVDGKAEPMRVKNISVPTPQGPVVEHLYETRFGPVVVAPQFGLTWTGDTAFALGDADRGNIRIVRQWLRIDEAKSVVTLRDALASVQGTPWVNTLAADKTGQVLYADYSVTPDLPDALLTRCTMPGLGPVLWSRARIPLLDGSRSACDWEVQQNGPHRGVLPAESMPFVVAKDAVLNSNDSYWLAHLGQPLMGYPAVIGATDTPQGARTRMGAAALGGLVHRKGGRITATDLQAMLFSEEDFWGVETAPDLARLCAGQQLSPDAKAGCAVLSLWDHRNEPSSRGAPFFRAFWQQAVTLRHLWRVPFDTKAPLVTPRGLAVENPAVAQALADALSNTVAAFRKSGLAPDVALGAVQHWPDGKGGTIALPGGPNADGVLDNMTTGPLAREGYDMQHLIGSSFIMSVHWQKGEPVAEALLTYGQSDDPASVDAVDQLQAYAAHRLFPMAFSEESIANEQGLRQEDVHD